MGLLEDKMKPGMTIKQGVIHLEDLKTPQYLHFCQKPLIIKYYHVKFVLFYI